jgi:hypothetical protein
MGGAVSILTAPIKKDKIAGIILLYPAIIMGEVTRKMFPDDNYPEVFENFLNVEGLNLSRMFFEDSVRADFFGSIASFDKPVFVSTGDNDMLIPVESIENAIKLFPNATIHVISGAPHGYPLNEDSATQVAGFMTGE